MPSTVQHADTQGAANLRSFHFCRDESVSQASWIFGFLRSYNIRDGLYCTYRAWAVVFISSKLLALRLSQHTFLAAAAQVAIGRIEEIVNSRRKRRRGKKVDTFDMTARELEVLQQRALLGSNAATAKALDITTELAARCWLGQIIPRC